MQFDTSHMITHREMLPQQRRAIGSKLFFQRQKLLLRRQGRASRGGVLPLAGICTLAILGLTVGCTPAPSRMSYDSAGDIGDVISGDQMFDDVVRTLNTLDKSLVTELRPPVVIRDANTSRNRKPMLAILTQHPDPSQRTGVCNTLIVRATPSSIERGAGRTGSRQYSQAIGCAISPRSAMRPSSAVRSSTTRSKWK